MVELFDLAHSAEWDNKVKTFTDYDVYYLSGYVKARRPTDIEGVYDSVTPYGYGGVLFEGDTSEDNLKDFWKAYLDEMAKEHIVDNFVRYHPVLRNAVPMKIISNVIDLGKTIAMDLSSPEVVWDNIHSKNRNMIRKAEKNGIIIEHGKGMDLFDKFIEIYNATMDKDHAEAYYYFKRPFYESIHNDLQDNYELFYAKLEDKIIAMSIMIFANGRLNYHLSGSDIEYRNLAPSNLLLYKTALWGCEHGFRTFHLGGGVGSGEDNLYKFKAAFNKVSDYQFSIGKQVFDQQLYDELVGLRRRSDEDFDETSHYFPLYRS